MKKRLLTFLLSVTCLVAAFQTPVSAALIDNAKVSSGPVLSGTSESTVVDRAYDYVLFDSSNSSKYLNYAYSLMSYTLLTSDNGRVYKLSNTALLNDATRFTPKITVTVNPTRARSVKVETGSMQKEGYACYVVDLNDYAVLDQQTVGYETVYTSLKEQTLPVTLTGTQDVTHENITIKTGAKIKISHTLHVNYERLLDLHYTAKYDSVFDRTPVNLHAVGADGVVIIPRTDYETGKDVVWKELNRIEAEVEYGGADIESFWKMSTRWNDPQLLKRFSDGLAFIRSFANSTFSGRVNLYLTNPYLTIEGEESIPHENVVIYELLDGKLYNVTSKFRYTTNSDDEGAFKISTDHLGTYIFYDRELV